MFPTKCVQNPTYEEMSSTSKGVGEAIRPTSRKWNGLKCLERLNLKAEAGSRWDGSFSGSLERVVHRMRGGVGPSVKE